MPDVLLSNDDVTVLGPPSIVEVLVDIGPTGTRGSQVFVGVGDPNIVEIGQTPLLNDLYINTSPGTDYGYLYQYVSQPGGDTWVEVLRLNPTIYSKLHTVTFASGTSAYAGNGSVVIPITNISTAAGLTAANFNVQYSIQNTKPLASSLSSVSISGTDLVINLEASEYDGTWTSFDAEVSVHIFVSVMI
jgi:hypothetical protein